MAWAEFEEKEYETAAVGELMRDDSSGRGFALSAGQVLEKIIGYDAVAAPSAAHVVWQILHLPRPTGVRLLPSLWDPGTKPPTNRLPVTPVTLILQFKRPEHLYGATASQWGLWGEPYYRFTREARQQRVLSRLEKNVGQDALVRYAAPAFWRRGQLEAAHLRGKVIEESGFVSPRQLSGHRVWTYLRPGVDGRGNPTGRPTHFESLEELLAMAWGSSGAASSAVVASDTLGEHVDRLGRAATAVAGASLRRDIRRWQNDLRDRAPELESSTVRRLGSVATLSSLLADVHATWLTVSTS